MNLTDSFGRIHDYIRISLVDRCNLNCIYCNPVNQSIQSLKSESILSYEELIRLINILVRDLEVKKIRFTGGEPLIRKDVLNFFRMLSEIKKSYPFKIGVTTNGTQLEDKIELLHSYGVNSLNISLDSLDKDKFHFITGKDLLEPTLRSISKSLQFSFDNVKLNAVIIKDVNDDEPVNFINHFHNKNLSIRFIEYMPFSGNGWDDSKFLSWEKMKNNIETEYKLIEIESTGKVAKEYFVEGSKLKIGFISSISNHFCDSCNRLRISASGKIKSCLFSQAEEINLKAMLSDSDYSDAGIALALASSLKNKWLKHPDADELTNLQNNNMMAIGG
jgi:molybdenum cofactor biosynthesis protein A